MKSWRRNPLLTQVCRARFWQVVGSKPKQVFTKPMLDATHVSPPYHFQETFFLSFANSPPLSSCSRQTFPFLSYFLFSFSISFAVSWHRTSIWRAFKSCRDHSLGKKVHLPTPICLMSCDKKMYQIKLFLVKGVHKLQLMTLLEMLGKLQHFYITKVT